MARTSPHAQTHQSTDLTDDFMFGFDVDDQDDREYLAELVMRQMGPEEDIRGFIQLGLRRGVEEWDQAICCASAMRDRAAGQDALSFLSTVYGVSRPGDAPSTPCSEASDEKRVTCGSLRNGVPVKKKQKRRRVSYYWADTPASSCQEGDSIGMARKKRKKSSEISKSLSSTVQKDEEVFQACEGPLETVFSDNHNESLEGITCWRTQERMRRSSTQDMSGSSGIVQGERGVLTEDAGMSGVDHEEDNGEADNNSGTDKAAAGAGELSAHKERRRRKAKSPYFESATSTTRRKTSSNNTNLPSPNSEKKPNKRPPRGTVSALPIPPLNAPRFGLIQEELANDPFRLLIAVTLLIRTSGKAAIPVFRTLMQTYPTPQLLADAPRDDIEASIRHLGLGVVRAATIQRYARIWVADPPRADVRRAGGWEIGHMTQGAYALDSWRIFCRDVLRGLASDWDGGGRGDGFQPEWMRVLPRDKELRACLRWLWMREGWRWDPVTGEKVVLEEGLRRAVQEGRVGYDEMGELRISDESA